MPEFAIVSVQEAQSRTIPRRHGKFLNEYASYIKQLPTGQAGKLHVLESENPLTIRRRLVVAAKALGVPLTIKRSGQEVYFWIEGWGEASPGGSKAIPGEGDCTRKVQHRISPSASRKWWIRE
jgi:hypothetical protein